ncbi:winged helix-turn-helix domain-containing protein [Haloarculaceae archaeon H-GB2-1]|nr:winged helix-turn-helix domain-containing protein [Haloarculaceae archaeon H-GB1-1]MEA5408624.1 winged helix-turn-helix domain-containing protein [Haloarculaceae archaeon H-GB2-1]
MSSDVPQPTDAGLDVDLDIDLTDLPVNHETAVAAEPVIHGAGVVGHIADMPDDTTPSAARDAHERPSGTLYDVALDYWRENVGDPKREPAVVPFDADWLPPAEDAFDDEDGDGVPPEYVLAVSSSRWKAGTGRGDNYSAYYQQHLKLRLRDADGELHKPSTALHVEIMPQYHDLVHRDGNELDCPYGEGTRIRVWTTWAECPFDITRRGVDALTTVYGDGALDVQENGLPTNLVPESHKISKAEAHLRVDIAKKGALVDTIRQTTDLIAYGGTSEVEANRTREREGWVEAQVVSDRWDHLGFSDVPFKTGLKLYQANGWAKMPEDHPMHHPKIEAMFSGADGALPHVCDWDDLVQHLRTVVSTHADWAGVTRDDLVDDDHFDGSLAADYEFEMPTGRREHLASYYDDMATRVTREALKPNSVAPYDILRVVSRNDGATYDTLVEQTGLARSTVRYHVARFEEQGILKRLSNPVLVVFDSRALQQQAVDALDDARPGDTADDLDERADQRRERRDQDDRARRDDGTFDSEDDQDDERSRFEYLSSLDMTPEDLFVEVSTSDGVLAPDDVRVRLDPIPKRYRFG